MLIEVVFKDPGTGFNPIQLGIEQHIMDHLHIEQESASGVLTMNVIIFIPVERTKDAGYGWLLIPSLCLWAQIRGEDFGEQLPLVFCTSPHKSFGSITFVVRQWDPPATYCCPWLLLFWVSSCARI